MFLHGVYLSCFRGAAGFGVEDLCINVFYWFESTKHKGILKELCDFWVTVKLLRCVNIRGSA